MPNNPRQCNLVELEGYGPSTGATMISAYEVGVDQRMFREVYLSSSVSSSSNSEKKSLSGASLGGGEEPRAICSSLYNLSRLSLL